MNNNVISCNVVYYNNIGILITTLLFPFKTDDQFKLKYKCEDGLLSIKLFSGTLKFFDGNNLNINILLNKSLVLQKEKTQVYSTDNKLILRFNVTSNLFSSNWIFKRIEALSVNEYCFDNIFPKNFQGLSSIDCINCKSNLIKTNLSHIKIVRNFNFDWEENIELLSCHSSHQDNYYNEKEFHEKMRNIFIIESHLIKILPDFNANFSENFKVDEKNLSCLKCGNIFVYYSLKKGLNQKEKMNDLFILYIHHLSFSFEGLSNQGIIQIKNFINFSIFKSLENNISRLHLTTDTNEGRMVTFFIEKNFIYQKCEDISQSETLIKEFISVLKIKYEITSRDTLPNLDKNSNHLVIYLLPFQLEEVEKILENCANEYMISLEKTLKKN